MGNAASCTSNCAANTADVVAGAMEDVRETIDDMAHDLVTAVIGSEIIPDAEVEAPTPEALWFSPLTGWPSAIEQSDSWSEQMPPLLCPTAAELPSHFERPVIGELKVEVLECDSLPQTMQLGRVDPYAAIVFEGNAARTSTMRNNRFPRWGRNSPRAFRFPVTCPYSIFYVCINDEDRGSDDGLGRVVVSLTSLRAHTLYDTWFPLQFGTLKYHVGRRGYVRLRFSLEFHSPRTRLLSYLKPHPSFVVPFYHEETDAAFAYRGRFPAHKFKWAIFSSVRRGLDPSDLLRPCLAPFAPLAHPATRGSPAQHLKELKASAFSIRDVAEQFLFCA